MIYKILIKFIIFLRNLLPLKIISNHRYLNKNQVTNLEICMFLLKQRGFYPSNILDIGCFEGLWTKKIMKIFQHSRYFLFDANRENEKFLNNIVKQFPNVSYKIKLLSNEEKKYKFYKMKSGSSIFEEKTDFPRTSEFIDSSLLSNEINENIISTTNNLIKIDAQGSEINILKGLKEFIDNFEVIILEVSLHNYNKDAPLFDEVMTFMTSKKFFLYDIFDLKRSGENKSFLFQLDCIFVRDNSKLLDVKF